MAWTFINKGSLSRQFRPVMQMLKAQEICQKASWQPYPDRTGIYGMAERGISRGASFAAGTTKSLVAT